MLVNRALTIFTTCGLVFLAACASEPPVVPPADLTYLASPKVSMAPAWRKSGLDTGRSLMQPLPLGDGLFVATRRGVVIRYERETGKVSWRKDLNKTLGAGVGGNDKAVYVSSEDGTVIALDAATGDELWTQDASSEVHVPAAAGFGAVVIRSADGRVVVLEPETGEERWSSSFTPPALTINGYSTPVLVDGGVLIGLDDGRLVALALDTGRVIWESIVSVPSGRTEVERLVDIDGDIQTDDEAIYAASYRGRIVRIEPGEGNIVWSTPMSSTAGLLLGEDKLYVVNEEDSVLEVDKTTGQIGWEQKAFRGRTVTRPVAINGNVLLVADYLGYVHLLDAVTGELVGRTRVGKGAVRTTPSQADDVTYIQSADGALAALKVR